MADPRCALAPYPHDYTSRQLEGQGVIYGIRTGLSRRQGTLTLPVTAASPPAGITSIVRAGPAPGQQLQPRGIVPRDRPEQQDPIGSRMGSFLRVPAEQKSQ
jgi:hypothetical protein